MGTQCGQGMRCRKMGDLLELGQIPGGQEAVERFARQGDANRDAMAAAGEKINLPQKWK